MCLVWRGKVQPRQILDVGSEIEILWDGQFDIDGQQFIVDTEHPDIGKRAILGYPIAELQDYLERTRENQQKFADIFDPSASDELTTELIEELVADGWERATLEEAAKRGDRYSRRRKSLLGAPVFDRRFFIRHMCDLDLGGVGEQLRDQVGRVANSERAVGDRSRMCSGCDDQLLSSLVPGRFPDEQYKPRRRRNLGDGGEIPDGVVGKMLEENSVGRVAAR